MNIEHIRYVQAIASMQSLTKAASILYISQPTLSHHMKILRDCGLVNVRKAGKWCYYSLNCDTLRAFQRFIASLDCTPAERECAAGQCG